MGLKQEIALRFLEFSGLNALFHRFSHDKAIILWYHGICDDNFDLLKGYDERHIPQSLFRKQLMYLKQEGYVFVTMSELVEALRNKKDHKKFVTVTFDDGFRNIVDNAYPVMKELNAKGCFYLVYSLIGAQQLLWTDYIEAVVRNCKEENIVFVFKGEKSVYPLSSKSLREKAMFDIKRRLRTISDRERKEHIQQFASHNIDNVSKEFYFADWDQIRGLDRNILEVGSHTINHPNCANLTDDSEFRLELKDSKEELAKKVGYTINHFCYPAGSYNEKVITKVKEFGYQSASTIVLGVNDHNTDIYQLRRISVNENFLLFQAYTSGSYFFIQRLLRWIKRA